MEESEKRRERLKAMRVEAAKADIGIDSESSGLVSHSLSNPLIEGEPAPSAAAQYSQPRFDYYTDPLSAFSSDKRRNNFSHQASQGYSSMPPNMTSSPGQRSTQSPGAHYSQNSSLGTPPMGAAKPWGKPSNMTSSPGPRSTQSPGSHYSQNSSLGTPPMGAARPWGKPQETTSSMWGGSQSNYSYSPNMPDVNFPNSGVGRGDSPYPIHGQGGGGRYNNSPHPQLHSHHDSRHDSGHYSDRGRGRGRSLGGNSSAGLGPSSWRGKNSHDPVSAELRPDLYYKKEMLEDPWKSMTPVIWKGLNSDKSWLPKSVSMKKARPCPEASHKSISQPSLAEYLATLNDTVNEPTHEEHEQSEVKES